MQSCCFKRYKTFAKSPYFFNNYDVKLQSTKLNGTTFDLNSDISLIALLALLSAEALLALLSAEALKNEFKVKESWLLKMGPICCPETSVRNYRYLLRSNPEQHSSCLLRGGSLTSPSLKVQHSIRARDQITLSLKKSYIKILLTLRRLMSYIYGAPILDVSRSHTTTQHSR